MISLARTLNDVIGKSGDLDCLTHSPVADTPVKSYKFPLLGETSLGCKRSLDLGNTGERKLRLPYIILSSTISPQIEQNQHTIRLI